MFAREKIIKIQNMKNIELVDKLYGYKSTYDGYVVETCSRTFSIFVDNKADCCEDFGYISSEDDLSSLNGSEILDIECVELDRENYKKSSILDNYMEYGVECLEAAFINIKSTKGEVQLAVYNSHNGYYGHDVQIEVVNK